MFFKNTRIKRVVWHRQVKQTWLKHSFRVTSEVINWNKLLKERHESNFVRKLNQAFT